MLGAVSFISVVIGTAAATIAERYPNYVETIETAAGVLLIGGIALAGSFLPVAL
jgi:putative Mn2+ efflux pump MntP